MQILNVDIKYPDFKELENYVKTGLLRSSDHPNFPLRIYTYSNEVQYKSEWDDITLNARSLIYDYEKGIPIAKGFSKFFNYEEIESQIDLNDEFEVYEKVDGSFCIIFYYQGNLIFSSKGSFKSDVAFNFERIFNEKYKDKILSYIQKEENFSWFFELIGPSNRIVNIYEEDDIVYLGRSHNSSFQEIRPDKEDSSFLEHIKIPIKYDLKSFKVSKSIIEKLSEHKDNFEGWVFVNSKNQRFKLKLEEYKRLHYILTGISNKIIWEMLSKKESLDLILDKIPDEFYFWIKNTIDGFQNSFDLIYNECKEEGEKWKTLFKNSNQEYRDFKKSMFFELKDNKYLHFILSYFDEKEIDEKIWKHLKPNEIKLYTKETEF